MAVAGCSVERSTVETGDGVKLQATIFRPEGDEENTQGNPAIVLVHPYSILGGCQDLLRGIGSGLASSGFTAVTFDMRGVGRSTGRASLTGFSEVEDVVAVCGWVVRNIGVDRVLLVGSSAGAPIAGSAVDKIEHIVGYVSLGYPFGLMASVLFGRHHKAILNSPKPKLFVMGTKDGFTSVKQLKNKLKSAKGRVDTHLLEGVSHFEMEGSAYDREMVNLILEFVKSL
ncbi:uncharacterized protein LOC127242884 [Andrographis paniculata]|uniref:uncharacterized protein LOC127242884 n=1 Tax=Andrographis paniculata TaxID=175694 RepID=UPI0021E81ECA|nr:uncharacterized protein LOC127242884 [Andrographis paniculata]XP_051118559.1 uncharacterized protein LOC127242884 [Andrographis paniculata]